MSPTSGWENFFVAGAGAAAALSGLVFVAVSISLQRIIGSRHLRARAIETFVYFLAVLAVSTCGLVPGQSARALGAEIAACGLVVWAVAVDRHARAYRDPNLEADARRWLWVRIAGGQASSLPFIAAGVLLIAGHTRGLVGIAPATLASFGTGALNAWVLLVEIQR